MSGVSGGRYLFVAEASRKGEEKEGRRGIGIVTGNPRVFQGYPDPYPPEPAPVVRVGVLAGSGRGF
jgi:hypothetical protein